MATSGNGKAPQTMTITFDNMNIGVEFSSIDGLTPGKIQRAMLIANRQLVRLQGQKRQADNQAKMDQRISEEKPEGVQKLEAEVGAALAAKYSAQPIPEGSTPEQELRRLAEDAAKISEDPETGVDVEQPESEETAEGPPKHSMSPELEKLLNRGNS